MRSLITNISLLILIALLAACSPKPLDPFYIGSARTYYESLDLDTPESAAQTFISAFQRLDFPTVFMILSGESQWEWGIYMYDFFS